MLFPLILLVMVIVVTMCSCRQQVGKEAFSDAPNLPMPRDSFTQNAFMEMFVFLEDTFTLFSMEPISSLEKSAVHKVIRQMEGDFQVIDTFDIHKRGEYIHAKSLLQNGNRFVIHHLVLKASPTGIIIHLSATEDHGGFVDDVKAYNGKEATYETIQGHSIRINKDLLM